MIASLPTPPAIATGSYRIAAVIGADDNALTKPQYLTAIAAIAVRAMNPTKPLTVDGKMDTMSPSWQIPLRR
ncbi:unnamed protein product [Penicillium roqueforti FM164]|uniref:Genomic scaffold, ProqFM164S04 n=1 Tax=Penicillium roqueforti (strain FM164) TaxID=1365484 RepID=W6QG78_PENRF|nr:unnamed protein product [Penicillium roqueforti FM164]